MNITYTTALTPDELTALRASVGWDTFDAAQTTRAIANSALTLCARDGGLAVGVTRVLTDYGWIAYINDVIVRPEYQGRGIGRELMTQVIEYINTNISPGQSKCVTLMAARGKEGFYEKFGFARRPNERAGCGMAQWIKVEEAAQ